MNVKNTECRAIVWMGVIIGMYMHFVDAKQEVRATDCITKTVFRSSDLPYVITEPGYYQLGDDVTTYTDSPTAITIAVPSAQPVTIDFCNHVVATGTSFNQNVVLDAQSPTILRNGTLVNASIAPVRLAQGFFIEVTDMQFSSLSLSNLGDFSLVPEGSSVNKNTLVANCRFNNVSFGIVPGVSLEKIAIENCEFRDGVAAVVVSNVTPKSSIICNCCIENFSNTGIILSGSSGWNIQYCTIENCNIGIQLSASTNMAISNCSVQDTVAGILASGNASVDIVNTIITDASSRGIEVGGAARATIQGCYIDNAGFGIREDLGSSTCVVKDSVVQNCQSEGISLFSGAANNSVQSCQVSDCVSTGIRVSSGSIFNCTSVNNGTNYVIPSPSLILTSNEQVATSGFYFRSVSK